MRKNSVHGSFYIDVRKNFQISRYFIERISNIGADVKKVFSNIGAEKNGKFQKAEIGGKWIMLAVETKNRGLY